MTKVGASVYNNAAMVDVSSIGEGANDGWTRVLLLPRTDLPNQSGSDAYTFVAWCSLGAFTWATSTTMNTVCEVALGSDLAPFPDQVHRVLFSDGRLRQQLAMVPVFWVNNYVAGQHGTWASNARGVAIWARIYTNGDLRQLVQGSFRVSTMGILAFSLVSLPTTQYVAERFAGAPIVLQPGRTNNYLTAQSGRFQAAGEWMIFTGLRYWPGTHGSPSLQINRAPTGSFSSVLPGFGRGGRFGTRARWSSGGAAALGRWDQQCAGGMCLWSSPPTVGQLALQCADPAGFPGTDPRNCAIAEFELFAIRADLALGRFNGSMQDPPDAVNLFNAVGVPSILSENFEWSRPFDEDTEVFFNAAPYSITTDPSFHPTIATNIGGGVRQGPAATITTNTSEQHAHIGTRYVALRPGEIQFRFYGYQNTFESPDAGYREPRDFAAAAWAWENDPDTTITPKPILPEMTFLVPGRESLDASLLAALPIAPDIQVEETFETARTTFVASDGTTMTWPRWLGVRRSLSLSWSGMTRAQRDTLTDFFRTNRTFKWTHHDEGTVIPLAIAGEIQTDDVGVLHTVRAQAIELVWTGSGV